RAQVEAHRRALEEMRRGGDAAGQLVEDGAGVGRADAHLREADLAEANFQRGSRGWRADRFGWLVHQTFLCSKTPWVSGRCPLITRGPRIKWRSVPTDCYGCSCCVMRVMVALAGRTGRTVWRAKSSMRCRRADSPPAREHEHHGLEGAGC